MNKKSNIRSTFYLIFLLLIALFSCSKGDFLSCDDEDQNTGLIEEQIFDFQHREGCFYPDFQPDLFSEGRVVQNLESMEALMITLGLDQTLCLWDLPDFGQKTVLALSTGATGCDRVYHRDVSRTGVNSYAFTIKITECGGCEPWEQLIHWVVIDKIDTESEVTFSVEKKMRQ